MGHGAKTHENKKDFFVEKIRFTHVFMVQLGSFFLLLIKKGLPEKKK